MHRKSASDASRRVSICARPEAIRSRSRIDPRHSFTRDRDDPLGSDSSSGPFDRHCPSRNVSIPREAVRRTRTTLSPRGGGVPRASTVHDRRPSCVASNMRGRVASISPRRDVDTAVVPTLVVDLGDTHVSSRSRRRQMGATTRLAIETDDLHDSDRSVGSRRWSH